MRKLTIPLIAAFLILLVAGFVGTRDSAVARYVSPPFSNGSRYTFLYPQRLQVQRSDGSGCFLKGPSQSSSGLAKLGAWWPDKRKSLAGMFGDEIIVQVFSQKPPYVDSRDNIAERRRQFLSIQDARSGAFFFIEHQGYGAEPSIFRAESAALNESFRVLKPGEKVPR